MLSTRFSLTPKWSEKGGGGRGVKSIFLVDLLRKTAAPPGYKAKHSEFLCDFSTFQNGEWSNWTQKTLTLLSQFENGIKSTKVSSGKKLYGILQLPFWAGQCLLDIHQIYAPVVSKLSELGYSPDYLTERPFHSGRLRTDYQTPLSNCAESPGELGFCNQPEEISVIPCTENRVYGCVG